MGIKPQNSNYMAPVSRSRVAYRRKWYRPVSSAYGIRRYAPFRPSRGRVTKIPSFYGPPYETGGR